MDDFHVIRVRKNLQIKLSVSILLIHSSLNFFEIIMYITKSPSIPNLRSRSRKNLANHPSIYDKYKLWEMTNINNVFDIGNYNFFVEL